MPIARHGDHLPTQSGGTLVGDPGQNVVYGALAGGVVGALAGRLIGASVASDTWTRVQTAGVQITMTPRAVGISVAF